MRIVLWAVIAAMVIQGVPYGHTHTNPAITQEPAWDSPQTRELFRRACYDCHSNSTTWPWYSHVAPMSWLVQNDVDGGREHLNFTEWNKHQRNAEHVASEIKEGDMPPWYYLPLHSDARLSDAEKQALIEGATKSLGPQVAEEKH